MRNRKRVGTGIDKERKRDRKRNCERTPERFAWMARCRDRAGAHESGRGREEVMEDTNEGDREKVGD